MIRYLELRNWRAFDKMALHFEPGTTFVVAENGIGKTSLLRGAAWTLFAPKHIDPKVELRNTGEANETVGVLVVATHEGDLEIERSYRSTRRPAHSVKATLDGTSIDPEELPAALTRLVGARPDIACQLGFVHQHALATDRELFADVARFLRNLTGVDQLQTSRVSLQKAQRRLEAVARELAKGAVQATKTRDQLSELIAATTNKIAGFEAVADTARTRHQQAQRVLSITATMGPLRTRRRPTRSGSS